MDETRQHQTICEYAEDAFSARNQAVEDVPFLKSHPHFIDCILREDSKFCTVLS
tara:strand:+ start:3848 stop:4009 length:162 start_codon:yes stop_codon:yes gene_type:complete